MTPLELSGLRVCRAAVSGEPCSRERSALARSLSFAEAAEDAGEFLVYRPRSHSAEP
jgi:hypothetical protein